MVAKRSMRASIFAVGRDANRSARESIFAVSVVWTDSSLEVRLVWPRLKRPMASSNLSVVT